MDAQIVYRVVRHRDDDGDTVVASYADPGRAQISLRALRHVSPDEEYELVRDAVHDGRGHDG